MSAKIRKELFWGSVIGLFVFAPCWFFFLNQQGYETPFDNLEDIPKRTVDAVLYGKEDPGEDTSSWERLMSYDLLDPPEEGETEEDTAEADAEAERLANWKANFPYQPTTDPDVVIAEEMLENMADQPASNHLYLRSFFENEARFSAQFEQLYRILEEHGRGDNPVVTGNILNCLWEYHQYSQKDPDSLSKTYCYRTERYCTNAEVTEMWKDGIVAYLYEEDIWPDRELMTETEAMALRDRIMDEIQGVDKMPYPRFVHDHDYEEELEVGFSPLVIRPGWQESYDRWEEQYIAQFVKDRESRIMSVGEGNVLLDNGQPIEYREGENTAALITPDGIEVPLHLDEDGKVIIPTPSEIEEMIANGEGRYVGTPDENANQPPPYLTEEEWKQQEALRQLKEAARQ